MSNYLTWFSPKPASNSDMAEVFDVIHLTLAFHEEVRHREAHETYCRWYYAVAVANQQEMQRMQRDINLLGWFIRK
jgi:hypothetical protein